MRLLTIGAFAREASLTPRALRLYDESGLLAPAAVDPDSGYRFYEPAQVERARLIAGLRRIGMPLPEIKTVAALPPASVAAAVNAYWQAETARSETRARQVALLLSDLSRGDTTMSEITIRYATRCATGSVRETNQDAAFASADVLAVADGGGGPAGAAASAAAVAALSGTPSLATLAATIDEVDRAWRGKAITTLTAIVRKGTQLALVHIGDTRAYLLRNGELSQLTHDHTWVQQEVDHGKLALAEAAAHPQRALLVRALGGGPQPVEADLALRTALPGDRYLLCSDGLSAIVDRLSLHETLTAVPDPDTAAQRLLDLALEAGAPDNIACVVADFVLA
ncbi:serine/threonine protein phosphatase PrpC [Actinoplanes tereljensis]|uniref:Protein phosphatase n=1 Tax=Paractinoplanes tereljensis TaxID=571912 RepID=A0A919NNM4_9ACTN|nr:MerR family transcriptional regulator [Actinoplanes tereljensis]GIF22194.1 hypothetical protein Ate02nite_49240 [Actinoplanes tereljensis]